MTKEEIDEALKSDDWTVRVNAVLDINATKEHLDIGIKDMNWIVRGAVISRIKEKAPLSIINRYFDTTVSVFLGTEEDWGNICLLYL